jgi:4-amino-4-deoxy-L-arabinose transferase-like glycosyltransferase
VNEAVFAPTPLSAPRSKAAAWSRERMALVLCAAACTLLLVTNIFRRDFYTGDEGFYGVTALNMVHAPDYLLRPSYLPAGDFFADRAGFAHPPFNSYLYALSLWLARGSLAGPEVVHVLAFAALLFFAYRIVALWDRRAAWCAVLLLAASPAMLGSYSLLEAEPLMTTAGIAALYCCLRGGGRVWFFLGGLCLGLAFAFKLWLCGPLVLAVGVALLARIWPVGQRAGVRQLFAQARARAPGYGLFLLGAVIPAAVHVLTIAWFHPADLGFWLKEIYFGIFMSAGISGSKFAGGNTPAEWMHPPWYYAAALYRDHFFLVPLIVFGGRSLVRDPRIPRLFLWVLLAGAIGLAPLSLMKVKEPLYVLSCTVFLYLLAGCCLAALIRRLEIGGKLDPFSRKVGTVICVGLMMVFPLAYMRHIQPEKLTTTFVALHTLTFAAALAGLAWSQRRKKPALLETALYAVCACAVAAVFGHAWVTRSGRDAQIARSVMPYLRDNPPAALSFVASNFKCYQFHTFRRGCYWRELPLHATPETLLGSAPFATVRVFILDVLDQRKPELAPWVQWLEAHTTEKTRNFGAKGESSPTVRVFVRDA